MTKFQQFDISHFFDQLREPLFLIDSEEIIFYNEFFKSNFISLHDHWKEFIQDPEVIELLESYFDGDDLKPVSFLKSLKSINSENLLFEWSFTPLPSSYQDRFIIVKGVRSKLTNETQSDFSLQYLESILTNTHDLITVLDKEGCYKFVGPTVGQKLGFKAEDIIGKNFRDLIDAGIIEIIKGSFEEALQSDQEVNIDFWVHQGNGKKIYIESFAKNLQHHPQINGVLFSARDITEYIQTDLSLQRRFELENIINKISSRLLNGNPKDLSRNFQESLEILSPFLNARYSTVLFLNSEDRGFEVLSHWEKEGEYSIPDSQLVSLVELVKGSTKSQDFGKVKLIRSSEESFFILVPIISSHKLKGILVLEIDNSTSYLEENELQILRQLGDILSGAYQGGQLLRKIERNETLLATTELLAKSGSWRYIPARKSFHFSGGLAHMFGMGESPTYAKFSKLIYSMEKEYRRGFINNLKETVATHKSTSGEFVMLSPEKKKVVIQYEIDARKQFFNQRVEVVGFCTDITHKRASEENLLLQSQILAQVNDPIVVTDPDLNFIYLNEAARGLLGQSGKQTFSGTIKEYFKFEDKDSSLNEFLTKKGESSLWKNEVFIKILDRPLEPFDISIQTIFSETNEKIGFSFVLRNLTEKYESEKLARRAQVIVENSPTILFRTDPNNDFELVYISENISRFGYDSKTLLKEKKSILDLLYPEDARQFREKAKLIKTEKGIKSFSGTYRFRNANGKYTWVEDQTQDVLNDAGEIILHEGIFQDINDRKNLEEINEERDRQYRILASNIPGTNIFLLDKERKYIVAEGTNFENWGMSSEDFEGKFLWEVQLTSYKEVNELLDKVYYEREIIESKLQINGRYYSRIFRPIIIRNEVEFVLSIIRDITEEHQAKIDLLQSEEKYRTLVEESTEIIFSLTESFDLKYVSPNVQQFLGYKTEEVIGRSIFEFLNPDDMGKFQEMLESTEDFLSVNQYLEFRLKHKNGEFKVFNSNGKLVNTKDGQENYYTGIARDISKLKEAQKELLKAKENAEQASQIKSQFLSVMSHEIRTPMNAVIGLSHLLVEGNPRPDQLENLKTLQFSAENLMALINDILDYNKIDSGKVELESVPFDLQNVVSRIVHSHSFQAHEKSVAVECVFDPNLPNQVVSDPIRLGQIINNLLSNAIKFTEHGFVKIVLEEIQRDQEFTEIEFRFEDSGIGIPEDKRDSIFEAFTQASSSTTRKYGGTGLGLAIVKRLVELFGGEISVSEREGGGSIFRFTSKLEIGKLDQVANKGPLGDLGRTLQEASILVAEDNYVNQILIQKFLKKWDVRRFVIVSDGKEALGKFKEEDFNLILLDLQMPVLDGFEVARAIRSHHQEKKRKTPILALTATSIQEVKDELVKIGFNDFVPKPFVPEILYEKLIFHLNGKDHSEMSV
ncbi:PAS domain S-box protein [Algoriphagus lutimaris]|uniref:PAS domain S-box protein n=1 Tax=Algoriphagus lutimaris TaxID=613197 RepID=UPI00196BAEFB|nr:PAS domain S-box protein [Algoriphagus lutimaris]MBN3519610.1 PAS domain S-box protein [Algoriphagus lutimaris]